MSDQSCATCARCVPHQLGSGETVGECTLIGAVVIPDRTGERCQVYRRQGVETVRVRIAVNVEDGGSWHSSGASGWEDSVMISEAQDYQGHAPKQSLLHWIEADLPVPVSETVEGVVS